MMSSVSTPIISARGITNAFGKQIVHDHLDFQIDKPEIIGLVGGSGSGKSVLMRTIVGLHTPNEGTIEIMGKSNTTPGLFGVLFQKGALFSGLTVEQNIMVPLKENTDLSDEMCQHLAHIKLGLVGLPATAASKYPSQLSGGMIKRVSLARALAVDPPILFLDEPTAGLDPIAAAEFDQLILDLQHSLGVTVIIITHDLDTLFTVCDKVAVLVDKKLTMDTIDNLLKSKHPWIQEYFHGPRGRAASAIKETQHGT